MTVLASLVKLGQRRFVALALAGGIAASGTMVWSASSAAFNATTVNPGNAWTTGSVLLHDDDGGANAMFNATASGTGLVVPGTMSGTKCIRVTYDGSLSATVKLFVAAGYSNPTTDVPGGGVEKLGDFINLKVEQGVGGAGTGSFGGGCGGFVKDDNAGGNPGDEIVFNNTLTNFVTNKTNFATGAVAAGGVWSPTAATQDKVFRFTWDATALPDDPAVQGQTFTCTFTWQAQG